MRGHVSANVMQVEGRGGLTAVVIVMVTAQILCAETPDGGFHPCTEINICLERSCMETTGKRISHDPFSSFVDRSNVQNFTHCGPRPCGAVILN